MRDYHIHTENSFDSLAKMEEYCKRAIELGFKEVAFMEHYDMNPKDESKGYFSYHKYMDSITSCSNQFGDQLKITAGLELGEPHEYWEHHEEYKKDKAFDIFIGSVHFVNGDVIHRTYEDWETTEKIYLDYFNALLKTVKTGNFNILGHIDVIKRYLPDRAGKFNPYPFKEIIFEVLKETISKNIAIEVNSSGLRQKLREPLPAYEIVNWYRSLGGEKIVFGSDAHRVEHLGTDYKKLEEAIKILGFKGFSKWDEGEWK